MTVGFSCVNSNEMDESLNNHQIVNLFRHRHTCHKDPLKIKAKNCDNLRIFCIKS